MGKYVVAFFLGDITIDRIVDGYFVDTVYEKTIPQGKTAMEKTVNTFEYITALLNRGEATK